MIKQPIDIKVGDTIQHRGWFWFGKVVEVTPPAYWSSTIRVIIDNQTEPRSFPIFSLIYKPEEFLYDWSEFDEAP